MYGVTADPASLKYPVAAGRAKPSCRKAKSELAVQRRSRGSGCPHLSCRSRMRPSAFDFGDLPGRPHEPRHPWMHQRDPIFFERLLTDEKVEYFSSYRLLAERPIE